MATRRFSIFPFLLMLLLLACAPSHAAMAAPGGDGELGMQSLAWRLTLPGRITVTCRSGDTLYVATEGGKIYAVALAEGRVIWEQTLGRWTKSSGKARLTEVDRVDVETLESSGPYLVASSSSGHLYLLAASSGKVQARARRPHGAYVLSGGGALTWREKSLTCTDLVTGKTRWTRTLKGRIESACARGDRVAVAAGQALALLSGSSGRLEKTAQAQATRIIAFDGYLFTQESGWLVARDGGTLAARWKAFIPLQGVTLRREGTLLFADTGKGYAVLEGGTGRVLHQGRVASKEESFVFCGGTLLKIWKNRIAVMDGASGARRWQADFTADVSSAQADGSRVYVMAGAGELRVYGAADGRLILSRSFREYLNFALVREGSVLLKGETDLALPAPGKHGVRRFLGKASFRLDLDAPSIISGVARVGVSGSNMDAVHYKAFRAAKIMYKKEQMLPAKSTYERAPLYTWDGAVDFDGAWRSELARAPLARPGLYKIVATSRGVTRHGYALFSQLGIVVKFGPKQMLVHVEDMKTHRPQRQAVVTVADRSGRTLYRGSPGLLSLAPAGNLVITARLGEDFAVYRRWGTAIPRPGDRLYLYTERPVYRPGQKVFFKGLARRTEDSGYSVMRSARAEIEVRDPVDTVIWKGAATTSSMGTFSGELTLAPEASLGEYSIVTRLEGKSFYDSFKVQAYRKPEFNVTLTPSASWFAQGEKATLTVRAAYYAGGPLRNRPVKYTVRARPSRLTAPNPVEEAAWYDRAPDDDSGDWLFVAEGKGVTDRSGEAVIEIDCRQHPKDMIYLLEAAVTDRDSREAHGETRFKVPRAALLLDASADREIFRRNEPFTVAITAVDPDGNPVLTPVEVLLRRREWRHGKQVFTTVVTQSVTTSGKGLATVSLQTAESGYLQILVKSSDEGGRPTDCERWVWIEGYCDVDDSTPNLAIRSDKDFYLPGETARLIINTKASGKTALVTVEGSRIHRVFHLPLAGASTYFELPLTSEFEPNVYFCVSLVSGGELVRGSLLLPVLAREKFLTLSLAADRKLFRPGETATFTLEAKDASGRPVEGDFSFGLVDASIYAIAPDATPDIRRFFYGQRENLVLTDFFIPQEFLAGGTQRAPDKPKAIRKKFLDTAFWRASVLTDRAGRARLAVPLPDNLTKWRATVRGATLSTEVGGAVSEIVVSKDLILRLSLPRFFTQGDDQQVTATVQNNSGVDRTVEVKLILEGVEAMPGEEAVRKVRVEKGGAAAVTWRLTTKAYPPGGKAVVTGWARALDDEGKYVGEAMEDAMELTLPVKPRGEKVVQYGAGEVQERSDLTFTVPESAVAGATTLTLRLSPSLISQVMGSLDYLASYPYGCVEQTMSGFLPDVVLSRTLATRGLRLEKLEKSLPAMVTSGLSILYGYQHHDGGWGWWKDDESNPHLTGYVLMGLALAKEAGFPVEDGRIRSGGQRALSFFQQSDHPPTRAYLLYALALNGLASKDMAIEFYKETLTDEGAKGMTLHGNALLAESLHLLGEDGLAKEILGRLKATAVMTATSCCWETEGGWGWMDGKIETNAACLRALIAVTPDDPAIPKIIRYLMAARRGNAWASTKDTAYVLLALMKHLPSADEFAPDYTAEVIVNGALLKSERVTAESIGRPEIVVNIPPGMLRSGANTVTLQRRGRGALHYTSVLTSFLRHEKIGASQSGITVKRTYRMQVRSLAESVEVERDTLVDAMASAGEKVRLGINGEGQVVILDPRQIPELWNEIHRRSVEGSFVPYEGGAAASPVFQSQLSIHSPADYEFAMVEDALPSGFEVDGAQAQVFHLPPGEKSEWRQIQYARREIRDDRVAFFFTRLPKGTVFIRYALRCETPGVLLALPARAELMYVPEICGASDGALLTVPPAEKHDAGRGEKEEDS